MNKDTIRSTIDLNISSKIKSLTHNMDMGNKMEHHRISDNHIPSPNPLQGFSTHWFNLPWTMQHLTYMSHDTWAKNSKLPTLLVLTFLQLICPYTPAHNIQLVVTPNHSQAALLTHLATYHPTTLLENLQELMTYMVYILMVTKKTNDITVETN